MNKSTVLDTCVVFYGRLWHEELVGCMCTFRTADCPRVMSTAQFPVALVYCYFVSGAVHNLCAGGCSKGAM